jgi:hypothetical protein
LVIGVNRVFSFGGKDYHIQAEDLDVSHACFEVRVYVGGTILWHKRIPYAELLAQNLPKAELDAEIVSQMERTIHTVQAAISKGKLSL